MREQHKLRTYKQHTYKHTTQVNNNKHTTTKKRHTNNSNDTHMKLSSLYWNASAQDQKCILTRSRKRKQKHKLTNWQHSNSCLDGSNTHHQEGR